MKKIIILVVLFAVLAGCSNELSTDKPSIELVSSTVEIVSDNPEQSQPVVDGELMDNIGFVYLKYNFVLKNNSKESYKVSGLNSDENEVETITINIDPNAKLKAIANEVTGVNLFSEKNHGGGFLSVPTVLDPNKEGHYSIEYILGSIEEVPEIITLAPTTEQLDELQEEALNANLVILYQNEEIKRFELKNITQ